MEIVIECYCYWMGYSLGWLVGLLIVMWVPYGSEVNKEREWESL